MKKILYRSSGFLYLLMLMVSFSPAAPKVLPTSLKITVLNELGNPTEGTEVTLYITKADYKSETNPIAPSRKTDAKGKVVFKNLQPIPYFVLAVFGEKSNIGAGVLTQQLQEGRINKVNTIIE